MTHEYTTTPGGVEFPNVLRFADAVDGSYAAPGAGTLIRSLWADLKTARDAANKAINIATETLTIIDRLQAENRCLRVEIDDAETYVHKLRDELDRYELVK